ncbi:MAG: glycoside hydrolase family 25 domain-containing protein [Bacilli bacterium]
MSAVWGIDTATNIDSTFLSCIEGKYGIPSFVGRYMETVPKVSDGLTSAEIKYLQGEHISILLIWNNFGSTDVSTYAQGQTVAKTAIDYAYSTLFVPAGKTIFADIELFYDVTAAWLQGWSDTFFSYSPSGSGTPEYSPGFYANPEYKNSDNAGFVTTFCTAVKNDSNVALTYIWANNATVGITTKANAPSSVSPPDNLTCQSRALIVGWQYGVGGTLCSSGPIDTDVWNSNYTNLFW